MNKKTIAILVGLSTISIITLQGCAAVAVGAVGAAAAGTTAVVATDPRKARTFVDDNKIEAKLQADYDDNYRDSKIYVNSYNGVILLTGQVVDEKAKADAEFDAKATPGANQIYNYLTIRLPQSFASSSNDSLITTKVRTKILGLPGIKSSTVKVITTDSVVYLFGIVAKNQGEQVSKAAANVSGVEKVITLFEYKGFQS